MTQASCATDVCIPPERWTDVRGDRRQLRTVLWLNGCPLHLEAVEVDPSEDGLLGPVAEEDEATLQALDNLYPARWTTMSLTWPGEASPREYVTYTVPFGD